MSGIWKGGGMYSPDGCGGVHIPRGMIVNINLIHLLLKTEYFCIVKIRELLRRRNMLHRIF